MTTDRRITNTVKILGHPRNAWHVAAWDHEVNPACGIVARRVCDTDGDLTREALL